MKGYRFPKLVSPTQTTNRQLQIDKKWFWESLGLQQSNRNSVEPQTEDSYTEKHRKHLPWITPSQNPEQLGTFRGISPHQEKKSRRHSASFIAINVCSPCYWRPQSLHPRQTQLMELPRVQPMHLFPRTRDTAVLHPTLKVHIATLRQLVSSQSSDPQ